LQTESLIEDLLRIADLFRLLFDMFNKEIVLLA